MEGGRGSSEAPAIFLGVVHYDCSRFRSFLMSQAQKEPQGHVATWFSSGI